MRKVILVRIILIEQTQFLILYSIFVKNLLWIVLVIEEEVVQVRLRRVVVLVIEARFFFLHRWQKVNISLRNMFTVLNLWPIG